MNAYAIIGLIVIGFVYACIRQFSLSLFTALIIIFGRTFYRYNSDVEDIKPENYNSVKNILLFNIALGFIFTVIYFKNSIKPHAPLINFILMSYMCISLMEWVVHKYIMHCTNSNTFIRNIISNIKFLDNVCKYHITHHVNVNSDMSVVDEKDDPQNDAKFRMGWNIYIPLTISVSIGFLFSRYISKYKISFLNIVILSSIISFIWEYIWNKTHTEMHKFEQTYSIKKGPYDNGFFNTEILMKLLYKNHVMHHAQKGDKKGNFDVIFLGADEWLNSNNKTVDNTEFCKTNMDARVCKTNIQN